MTDQARGGSELWAITPLDGRYRARLTGLSELVSEGGLIRYRIMVEIAWLKHLAKIPQIAARAPFSQPLNELLARDVSSLVDAAVRVKTIEQTTNHDVKAVEYYLQEQLRAVGASDDVLALIHFACTSEDINNLSYALMYRDLRDQRLLPLMDRIIQDLRSKAELYAGQAMLARTHGQTASPTTLGKELAVFGHRLERQRTYLAAVPMLGKINGAVGNYNAHHVAFPELNWPKIARSFVEEGLGLSFNPLTTQIENHDGIVEMADVVRRFNGILIGLCRDVWGYISLGYLRQRPAPGEIGSSTMPHKVNPIDFENAEGNLGLANAIATHFADKLPISRWQRDLSDSTVLRATGTLIGHSELAYHSLLKGLGKVASDPLRLASDLDAAWEVLAEPVQTVMRRYGVVDAYERLKAATRGKAVTRDALHELIDQCSELPAAAKTQLKDLSPAAYVGIAEELARNFASAKRET